MGYVAGGVGLRRGRIWTYLDGAVWEGAGNEAEMRGSRGKLPESDPALACRFGLIGDLIVKMQVDPHLLSKLTVVLKGE